jgi:hypothetical protein
LARAAAKGQLRVVEKILGRFRVVMKAERSLHQGARDDHGRVPESFRPYIVLDEGSVRSYEAEVVKHVGSAKAGWETAARALGVPLPDWVSRHETPGRFKDDSRNADEPAYEISNDVVFADDFEHLRILERALANRERSMRGRIERELGNTFASYS